MSNLNFRKRHHMCAHIYQILLSTKRANFLCSFNPSKQQRRRRIALSFRVKTSRRAQNHLQCCLHLSLFLSSKFSICKSFQKICNPAGPHKTLKKYLEIRANISFSSLASVNSVFTFWLNWMSPHSNSLRWHRIFWQPLLCRLPY